ncbi:MAG: hypothetical protein ACRC41_18085 [Sarcina sp.]
MMEMNESIKKYVDINGLKQNREALRKEENKVCRAMNFFIAQKLAGNKEDENFENYEEVLECITEYKRVLNSKIGRYDTLIDTIEQF